MVQVFTEAFLKELDEDNSASSVIHAIGCGQAEAIVNLRAQIEYWFEEVDSPTQEILLSALRSLNNLEFYPAFFSLVLHKFMYNMDWDITFAPGQISTPTFSLQVPHSAVEFDMEVAAIIPEDNIPGRGETYYKLREAINEIEGRYTLAVHVRRWLPPAFDPTEVRDSLSRWIEQLAGDDAYANKRAQYVDEHVDIEFSVLERVDQPQQNLAKLWLPPLGSEEHFSGLSEAIEEALTKARASSANIRRPFIVALCHGDSCGITENAIINQLLGKPRGTRTVSGHSGGRQKVYDFSECFRRALFNKPGNEALSAVILMEKCWRSNEACFDIKVFHNPWTNVSLPTEVFGEIPQLVPISSNSTKKPQLFWKNHQGQVVSLSS